MEYHIGQRWVSHADTALGLGICVEVDERRVTINFPAVGEDRTYAAETAPLTRLQLKPGDTLNTVDGQRVNVESVSNSQNLLIYEGLDENEEPVRVSELELDPYIRLTTPQQRLLNGHFDRNHDFALRVATLEHRARLQQSGLSGLLGSRTSLLPHQVYIAHEVGGRQAPRVMLADEVGLGKTIEAGMILHQQLLTGRMARVLILVPEPLLHQWLVEMLRRFNLHFSLFDAGRLAEAGDDNPFETEQLILTSPELLLANPLAGETACAAPWDMVVVDEAHHLHWNEESGGDEDYRLVQELAERTAGLLLLTATPEQIGKASHFARLRLLDPDRFSNLQNFLQEESTYSELNRQVKLIEAGTVPENLPPGIHGDAPPREIIRQLLDRHGTGRVLFRNSRSAMEDFPTRVLHEYPLEAAAGVPPEGSPEQQLHPETLAEDDSWLESDSRVRWLVDTLKSLRPAKVLVICALQATAQALEHYLHMRAGIRSAAFFEGMSIIERDRSAAYFADESHGAQVLVCSEIGSEGRNFQFAQHLVLFDLPLNPDLLEQRIGRLDRIGQSGDIHIHVPYVAGTAQETLFQWYHRGIDLFRNSTSAGYAIYEAFGERLRQALRQRGGDFEELLDDTAEFTASARAELEAGRDRLLEINSCDRPQADRLIDEIRTLEASDTLQRYLETLCDAAGVEHDFHSEHALVLRPGEHFHSERFPALNEEGVTVTVDRDKALVREDMAFLTWEHPLIQDAMVMTISSGVGNAALGTLKLKGIAPGNMLLEAIYTANCPAPRHLQLQRYLPVAPIRLLIDSNGRDLSAAISHTQLNQLLEPVRKHTAVAIIKQVSEAVESKMASAVERIEPTMVEIRESAEREMTRALAAEISRLRALREVNPLVREEEIQALEQRLAESRHHIHHATAELQALRLIVTR